MHGTNTPVTKNISDGIIYCISALVVPSIFLLNLYNRNRIQNHLPFSYVLIFAAIMAVVSIGLFFLLSWVARSYEGGLLAVLGFWVSFWLFEALFGMVSGFIQVLNRWLWLVIILLCLSATVVCLRRFRSALHKAKPVFSVLAIALCALFLVNLMPGVQHELTLGRQRTVTPYIKQDFNINTALPSPDIYWFHMDGMLSLATIERHLDECQNHVREALGSRGFVIYEDAILNAGSTALSLPVLLSPYFYDNYFSRHLENVSHLFLDDRVAALDNALAQDGLEIMVDVLPYHEMFHALAAINYEIIRMDFGVEWMLNQPFDRFYRINREPGYDEYPLLLSDGLHSNFFTEITDLVSLMTLTTPFSIISDRLSSLTASRHDWLPIPDYDDMLGRFYSYYHYDNWYSWWERQLLGALYDATHVSSPRFVYTNFLFTHLYHWWIQAPNYDETRGSLMRPDLYILAHDNAVTVMLNAIDMILEQNPNAIIVIQADHGWHAPEMHSFLLEYGHAEAKVLELYLSVMSAVRIPPEYGGLYAPLEPRNISRELVNRFVGENYTLLP